MNIPQRSHVFTLFPPRRDFGGEMAEQIPLCGNIHDDCRDL
jgi:hypothetical protein